MDRDEIRTVSHHLFGNKFMLEVAVAIALMPKARFTQKDVADATLLDKALVDTALRRLVKAGFLSRAAREGREQPLVATESTLWEARVDLQKELERPATQSGR